MIISLIIIIILALVMLYVATRTTSNDTEIIIGQKRNIKEIGERIQNVLDTEKTEKKQERKLSSVATEASKLFRAKRFQQSEKKYLAIIKEDHNNIKAYTGIQFTKDNVRSDYPYTIIGDILKIFYRAGIK